VCVLVRFVRTYDLDLNAAYDRAVLQSLLQRYERDLSITIKELKHSVGQLLL
jgi:hypothetical protein